MSLDVDLFGVLFWNYENFGAEVYLLKMNDQSFLSIAWDSMFGWKIDLFGIRLTDYDYGDIL